MIVIIVASVFIIYKKKQIKIKLAKQSINTEDNLDNDTTQENPYAQVLSQHHIFNPPTSELNVKGLHHTVFNINDSELNTKEVFNPIGANKPIRHNRQLHPNKPIIAQPFVFHKSTNDRFSIKRQITPPYINKTKVEFAPIKNDSLNHMKKSED
jgi:hypothetical protein